jgi:D-alanine-D-alanine ligase
MNIALLLGGTSPERHVSMASGRGVAAALVEAGHTVTLYDPARGESARITLEELELPRETSPTHDELDRFSNASYISAIQSIPSDTDVAFLALHGAPGEDGTVQSLLELRGIPYTGSGVLASALAMDKAMTKRILESQGIQTPRWFQLHRGEGSPERLRALVDQYTAYPVVVKPNDGGSTVGMTIVEEESQLVAAFELACEYASSVLFEEFIEGRELTVAILGGESLPIVEISPKSGFYDYKSKYTAGQTDYFCPADLPRSLEEEVRELARRSHVALGCDGYSRVDFRLSPENVPYCLEVNTLPGMTATSLVPKAAAAAGMSFPALCTRILELALDRERVEL